MKTIAPVNHRAWIFALVAAVSIALFQHVAQAQVPEGWKTYKGAYFEIGVPPGFVAKSIKTNGMINGAVIVNAQRGIEFQVYSPQWDGVAPFKKASASEKVESRNVEKSGVNITEDISISAKDGSYIRFVLSQSVSDDANGTHTNKTFGVKAPDMTTYGDFKKIYVQWKKTLTQFAD